MGPQCEDGYTKIANELLDALVSIRIPGESMQIFLLILRKTYGYAKKEDRIALSQFQKYTGITRTHIQRGIDKLVAMNIVTQKGNNNGVTYGINKHYNTWKALPKKVTVTQKGNRVLPKKGHTKEKVTKENTLTVFFEKLWAAYPRKIGKPDALRHFLKTVKTPEDMESIGLALSAYLNEIETTHTDKKYIKHGSAWFYKWQGYIPEG